MTSPFNSLIVRTLLAPLEVCLQLFAVYVYFHGHYSPGGGFQGGVLLAAAFIIPLLLTEPHRPYLLLTERGAVILAAVGVLIYAAFAVVPLLAGSELLNYGAIPMGGIEAAQRRSLGILGIELGVLLGVSGAVVSIFYSLRRELESVRHE